MATGKYRNRGSRLWIEQNEIKRARDRLGGAIGYEFFDLNQIGSLTVDSSGGSQAVVSSANNSRGGARQFNSGTVSGNYTRQYVTSLSPLTDGTVNDKFYISTRFRTINAAHADDRLEVGFSGFFDMGIFGTTYTKGSATKFVLTRGSGVTYGLTSTAPNYAANTWATLRGWMDGANVGFQVDDNSPDVVTVATYGGFPFTATLSFPQWRAQCGGTGGANHQMQLAWVFYAWVGGVP